MIDSKAKEFFEAWWGVHGTDVMNKELAYKAYMYGLKVNDIYKG